MKNSNSSKIPLLIGGVIIATIVVTFLTAAFFSRDQIERSTGVRFQQAVATSHDRITDRIERRMYLLAASKGFFDSSTAVDAEEFSFFFDSIDLKSRHPQVKSVSFVKALPDQTKQILTYNYPKDESELGKEGIDLSSGELANYITSVRDSGEPATTDVIEGGLVVLLQPLYAPNRSPTNLEERRANFSGVIMAVFTKDLLFVDVVNQPYVQVEIHSSEQPNLTSLVTDFKAEGTPAIGSNEALYQMSEVINIGSSKWSIVYKASEEFANSTVGRIAPLVVIITGAFVVTLIVATMYLLFTGQKRAQQFANTLTVQLEREIKSYQNMLNSLKHMIITFDNEGKIKFLNEPARAILGYTFADYQALNVNQVADTSSSGTRSSLRFFTQDSSLSGNAERECNLIKKDGTQLLAQASVGSLGTGSDGLESYILLAKDITEKRKAELEERENAVDLNQLASLMLERETKMAELKKELEQLKGKA